MALFKKDDIKPSDNDPPEGKGKKSSSTHPAHIKRSGHKKAGKKSKHPKVDKASNDFNPDAPADNPAINPISTGNNGEDDSDEAPRKSFSHQSNPKHHNKI